MTDPLQYSVSSVTFMETFVRYSLAVANHTYAIRTEVNVDRFMLASHVFKWNYKSYEPSRILHDFILLMAVNETLLQLSFS